MTETIAAAQPDPLAAPDLPIGLTIVAEGETPPEDDGRIPVTVRLSPRHHAYLVQRAAQHGETPGRHVETILRNFRAYFDDKRPELAQPAPERGSGAVVRRLP